MSETAGKDGTEANGRLVSLDAFRGITIAGMILVNNPGTWSAIYPPLAHAEWHGWTPTDLIFPFFLFIVGVAITLALGRRAESEGERGKLSWKITKRSLIIFGLGMFLAGFPYFNLATIRIPGVLQRIAVCYFCAALIFLKTNWRQQALIASALLLLYWLLMMLVPVPGYGAGLIDSKEANLAAYLDRLILGAHIWRAGRVYDPEGILSTLPAIATTLCGALAGRWLEARRAPYETAAGLFVAGCVAIMAGWLWGLVFPINKPLWTSSYVVFTAGMALQLLALCYWLIDIKGYRRWAMPFVIFGVNALAVFVLSGLLARLLGLWQLARPDGSNVSLQRFIFERFFASWAAPVNASLYYAICFTLLWLGLMALLYRRRIYIKV